MDLGAIITSDTTATLIDNVFLGGSINGYYSLIIEYSLISGAASPLTTAGRTGQFMAVTNGGIDYGFTDFSTPSIGNEPSPPILSFGNIGNLVITSGSGYTFRGYIKRF